MITSSGSLHIIDSYQHIYHIFKRYVLLGLGALISAIVIIVNLLNNDSLEKTIAGEQERKTIGYKQTDSILQASSVYYNQSGFLLGDFTGYIIGGSYHFDEGKHIGKSNLISYQNIALPQHITTNGLKDYLGQGRKNQLSNYIHNFITLDTQALQSGSLDPLRSKAPQVDLIKHFHLGCINSLWKINDSFCQYNIQEAANSLYTIDLIHSIKQLALVFQSSDDQTKNTICQSIINYEMKYGDIQKNFEPILERCKDEYITKHYMLTYWQQIQKELQTTLTSLLYSGTLLNQFKAVSAMQLLHTQIASNTIDIDFLNSYSAYISEYLKSPTIDSFMVDLIYVFHNQYLIPGCIELQKVVNVDTVRDLQNSIDSLDSINNGDGGVSFVGLRYKVSPEVIDNTDYASMHPVLGSEQLPVFKPSKGSGVDNTIINTLIGSIDNTIQKNINEKGEINSQNIESGDNLKNEGSLSQEEDATASINSAPLTTGEITSGSVTSTPNKDIYQPSYKPSSSNKEEDLNTYQPQKAVVYAPGNTIDKQKLIISDRIYNNLGLRPTSISIKSTKQFVEREYGGFDFSAILSQEDDRKLYPIYVQLDGVRTIIPAFELYLMDYDRYSQVKFLKNPEQYVRQATQ